MKKRMDKAYNSPRRIPKIDSVLASLVSSNPELSKLTTIMNIMNAWKETVGEKLAEVTKIVKYENSILFVKVTSSVWRNEFFHIEDEIKTRLRAKLGKIKITKIIFV
ncbi:MAG: DUF721 domain-containing protein [Candidatus Delongbacteria bacterium]|nr:DUF721 domain-containing protein [Candidatus Delongbacteria bacterium]MCG2761392.1 DUF721 domain-containing protein [Candidatus Delongbacteria bacterium]